MLPSPWRRYGKENSSVYLLVGLQAVVPYSGKILKTYDKMTIQWDIFMILCYLFSKEHNGFYLLATLQYQIYIQVLGPLASYC